MSVGAVRVRGPFCGTTGYDVLVREYVRALLHQGVAVQLLDLPNWTSSRLPSGPDDALFASLSGPVGARVSLQFCMPHQVSPEPELAVVNYTMFEATGIPQAWAARACEVDLTVLPTESSRSAWIASGAPPERLRLCSQGVDAQRFSPDARPLRLLGLRGEPLGQYRRRFLNVSEPSPRKNLTGLLRVWLRATTPRDDAVLIFKLGTHIPGSRAAFLGWIEEVQAELGKTLDDAAPACAIHAALTDAQMPRLFAAATHYVSLSCGEGWDQAMTEAAATDLRLIAPAHSAYLAYLDDTIADLIPSREVPAAFAGGDWVGRLFENVSWWLPDEDRAVALIRAVIDGAEVPKGSARARLAERFSWGQATARLIEVLGEAEALRRPAVSPIGVSADAVPKGQIRMPRQPRAC